MKVVPTQNACTIAEMVGIEVDLTSAVQTRSSLALRALQGHVPTVSYSISVRACTCAQLDYPLRVAICS